MKEINTSTKRLSYFGLSDFAVLKERGHNGAKEIKLSYRILPPPLAILKPFLRVRTYIHTSTYTGDYAFTNILNLNVLLNFSQQQTVGFSKAALYFPRNDLLAVSILS